MAEIQLKKGVKMRQKERIAVAVMCIILVAASAAFACTTILVGKDVSGTGYVLVGHNEDDGGRAMVEHGYVDARSWKSGYTLPAEDGRAAIPQVSSTYGFWWSQVKPAEGGYSNADGFFNENGVFCVSNSCANSKIDTKDASRLTDGGIEYNLRRVVAERATSARNAVDIIIDMVEKYGYAPSGRTYTVADKDEAWMVQIVSGRIYVAIRCPDDEVVVFPNHYTVHSLDDYAQENIIFPNNIMTYAKQLGIYEEVDGKFDFAKTYQNASSYKSTGNTFRQSHGMSMVQNKDWTEDFYPFSIKPAGKMKVEDVMDILKTHYEGTYDDPAYLRAQVPGGNPHDTTLRRICTGSTVESTVCQFDSTPLLTTLWTAFGRPCELPYIPLHPLAGTPKELSQMADSNYELENHLNPDASIAALEESGWMKFREFECLFELVYQENIDRLTYLNESRIQVMKAADQKAVSNARNLPDSQAKTLLFEVSQKAVAQSLEQLQNLALTLRTASIITIGKPSLSPLPEKFTILFTIDKNLKPIEETLKFGLGFTNTRTRYLSPIEGSLQSVGNGKWQVSFNASDMVRDIPAAGKYDFFLGGRTTAGYSFTGETIVTFLE